MENEQIVQYLPVLILGLAAIGMTAGMMIASVIVGQRGSTNQAKNSAYECGVIPTGEGTPRFSIKFYLVAMLFVLFDIEVIFIYPWAIIYREFLKNPATTGMILGAMLSFLAVLFIGYLYALKKKAFSWRE